MIVIASYDSAWPALFAAEAARIRASFGAHAKRIEHVGSTAVPGLAAKPVIDIQISVDSLASREFFEGLLKQLDYAHFPLGEFDLVYPFFKRPFSWPSTHHVHLCVSGSEQEWNHIAFRDYLRCNPAAAAAYVELKRGLAVVHHGLTMESQEQYSLAKTEFIRSTLSEAVASTNGPEAGLR